MNAPTNDTEGRPDERRPHDRKVYSGCRSPEGCTVWVTDKTGLPKPLNPRWELRNHSPTGFEWGYGGSGPAQLALAILTEHLGDDRAALNQYQPFNGRALRRYPAPAGRSPARRSTIALLSYQTARRH
jgi:hypothetical protein